MSEWEEADPAYSDLTLENEEQEEEVDETGTRFTWEVITWVILALTIILNLILIGLLLIRRNLHSIINKLILTVGVADLLYACLVSPFFVENYIKLDWQQTVGYCKFYTYFFTFHDLFPPFCLLGLSVYVSLKFTGVTEQMKFKRPIYLSISLGVILLSLLLSIPATIQSTVFIDTPPEGRNLRIQECRSWDVYTMLISYSIFSSLLFCFTMSFLFSLCILGSPLLRHTYDPDEHSQRWRLLLTLSLVNIFYIICGFLLNFKELSRFLYKCCALTSPLEEINNLTYDVWNFLLLACEPLFRPLIYLTFYLTYIINNDNVY